MSQLLKKYALLTACAVLALFFTMRPAHAQSVNDGGTGEHLLFTYWSTANYMNTNLSIHSPLGVRNTGEAMNVVRVKVRDTMGESLADFKICLMPGESWTAAMAGGMLTVVDGGRCDDKAKQDDPSRTTTPTDTEALFSGMPISLGADSGYFEAWLAPTAGLKDDTVACSVEEVDLEADSNRDCTEGVGFDVDTSPDDATPTLISGMAMLVSPMSGFSSSYNAVALTGCGRKATASGDDTRIGMTDDDGNACWHVEYTDADDTEPNDTAGAPIERALMAQSNDLLTGRWLAINDDNIMSHTKLVLTWPVNNLNYEADEALPEDPDESTQDAEGTDALSIFAFNEMGDIALENRELMLDMNVNMCQFMPAGSMMDDGMMDDGMMDDGMMDDGMPMLSCNGEMVGELDGMAGEFRIFNNVAVDVRPRTQTGSPPAGIMSDNFLYDDGTEGDADDLGPISQFPDASIAAIGLNFSYFMGTDGVEYDQATPVQSIDIPYTILTGTPGSVDGTSTPANQTTTTVYFDDDGYARAVDDDEDIVDPYINVVPEDGEEGARVPEHLATTTTGPLTSGTNEEQAASRATFLGHADAVKESIVERHL